MHRLRYTVIGIAFGLAISSVSVYAQQSPWLAVDPNGDLYVIANGQKSWIVPAPISAEDLALIPPGPDALDGLLPLTASVAQVPEVEPTPEGPPAPPPPAVDINSYVLIGTVGAERVRVGSQQQLCVQLRAPNVPPVPHVPVVFHFEGQDYYDRTGPDGKACVMVFVKGAGIKQFNATAEYGGRKIALEGGSKAGFEALP